MEGGSEGEGWREAVKGKCGGNKGRESRGRQIKRRVEGGSEREGWREAVKEKGEGRQ